MRSIVVDGMMKIEGMTDEASGMIFYELLDWQKDCGPLLEVGSYRGRSAFVLANCARGGETVFVVDPEDRMSWEAFGNRRGCVSFIEGYSENLPSLLPDYDNHRGTFRFFHTDASHTFENVVSDLRQANELLSPAGIAVVDDYQNENYPQVPFGVGAAIFQHGCDFRPFLIASNKAYLCRQAYWPVMMRMVLERLSPSMPFMALARTDLSEFSPYALRPATPSDEDGMYGPALYRYYIKDWLN